MIGFCKHAYCVVIMCRWCVDKLSRCWWLWWKRCTVKFFKHLSWSETFLSHWRQPEVYVLAFSTFSCPTNKLQSSHFSSYNLTFWMHEKGVIRIKRRSLDCRLTSVAQKRPCLSSLIGGMNLLLLQWNLVNTGTNGCPTVLTGWHLSDALTDTAVSATKVVPRKSKSVHDSVDWHYG